jgi:hypothetical protein
MKSRHLALTLLTALAGSACGVEPPYNEPSPTDPTSQRGVLRGSVILGDLPSHGMPGVLIALRNMSDDVRLTTTDADGAFAAEVVLVEWRAELQLPDGFERWPGETGTRVALAQPDRVITLLPFRIRPAGTDPSQPPPTTPGVAAPQP